MAPSRDSRLCVCVTKRACGRNNRSEKLRVFFRESPTRKEAKNFSFSCAKKKKGNESVCVCACAFVCAQTVKKESFFFRESSFFAAGPPQSRRGGGVASREFKRTSSVPCRAVSKWPHQLAEAGSRWWCSNPDSKGTRRTIPSRVRVVQWRRTPSPRVVPESSDIRRCYRSPFSAGIC